MALKPRRSEPDRRRDIFISMRRREVARKGRGSLAPVLGTLVLACWALIAACSSDDDAGPCTPGKSVSCACKNGSQGTQACAADGKSFGPCTGCGTSGSGGSSGAGGSGGSSGAGGSTGGTGGGVSGKRTGKVSLAGSSLMDDQGPFNALGATLMWAAWGYKNDLARLEQNLDYLSKHGFQYIRALGVVGDANAADYWDGREIVHTWPDYEQVIAGLTDLCFDKYGLRVEWTLIGDGQVSVPTTAERYALVDQFLAMSKGREQKIIHFEIANEAWQNGFAGDSGITELRALSQYMNDKTDVLVAASAPAGQDCASKNQVYSGSVADLATIHFDRDLSQIEGAWRPVRQPWEHENCSPALPVGSNNEPIGPGASVASENDPVKLVAAAITTYVSRLPLYVFHSKAGVRGDEDLWQMAGADAFGQLTDFVPADLASWTRKNANWADSPFVVYAEEGGVALPDTMWPDLQNPTSGAVRAYGSVKAKQFFVFPIGIKNHVLMAPRQAMSFDVIDPMTGTKLESKNLVAGEKFTLSGAEALVLSGSYL